jgi:hypothetical protein
MRKKIWTYDVKYKSIESSVDEILLWLRLCYLVFASDSCNKKQSNADRGHALIFFIYHNLFLCVNYIKDTFSCTYHVGYLLIGSVRRFSEYLFLIGGCN